MSKHPTTFFLLKKQQNQKQKKSFWKFKIQLEKQFH